MIPHTVMVVTPGDVILFYLGCVVGIGIVIAVGIHAIKKLFKKMNKEF